MKLLLFLLCMAGSVYGQKLVPVEAVQGDNYENLQNAINFAIKNPGYVVSLAAGTYNYSRPLLALVINGEDYGQVSFVMSGPQSAKNAPDPRVAILAPAFNNAPALSIQKGKGVRIENIYFRGKYLLPNSVTPYTIQTMKYADWDDHQSRQNRYTPYAGAAVDPFSNPGHGFGEMYPGLEKYYLKGMGRAGSTGVDFVGCRFTNFPVGILYEPEAQQNGDLCNVIDCTVEYCKVGISYCQDQTKGNQVVRLRCWGNVHTLIDCGLFGRGIGTMPFIDGMNVAGGVYELFFCPSGRFTGGARDIYAELIFKIGFLGGRQPTPIYSSTFDFINFGWSPDFIIYGDANFYDCHIRIYNGKVNKLNFSGFPGKFTGGSMERPITTSIMNHGIAFSVPQFHNVRMLNEDAWGGLPLNINDANWDTAVYIGQAVVEVNKASYTATLQTPAGVKLKIGNYLIAGQEAIKYYDSAIFGGRLNMPTVQVGRVMAIEGRKVTLDQVSISMIALSGKPLYLFKD